MTVRHIYFVRPVGAVGPVKIGISARPQERVIELLEWSPVDLEIAHLLPGNYKLERDIHDALANDHIRREWFKATPRVCNLVEGLRAGRDIAQLIDLSLKEGSIYPDQSTRRARRSRKAPFDGAGSLTAGQRDCLTFIEGFVAEKRRVPTYREIMVGLDLRSTSGVFRFISGLEERGYLTRTPGRWSCIALVEAPQLARAA